MTDEAEIPYNLNQALLQFSSNFNCYNSVTILASYLEKCYYSISNAEFISEISLNFGGEHPALLIDPQIAL